jgi:cytosine/adenosine deaminase-related metal-dependent hydrolase
LAGLINTHVHTSQQLGRGIADDVDLLTWLHGRIWPYESHMTEEDSYLSTLLCGIELIHSGVTCFAEAGGQHVPGMARAVQRLGIRACLARSTMDSGEGLPQLWAAETTDSCLQVRDLSWLFHVCNIPRSLLGLHFVCQSVRILVKD